MTKILISIPDSLAYRMRSIIPAKQRSALVVQLIERIVKKREKQLYDAALAVENDEALRREMAEWDITSQDGIDPHESW